VRDNCYVPNLAGFHVIVMPRGKSDAEGKRLG